MLKAPRGKSGLTPGSDMASFEHEWDVDGIMSPEESVSGMLEVIVARTRQDSGTFWRWDGQVSLHCIL